MNLVAVNKTTFKDKSNFIDVNRILPCLYNTTIWIKDRFHITLSGI